MTGGSGATFDYWHVDDVCFTQTIVPVLLVSKIAQTLSDPVNGGSNPKAIPGAVVQYTQASRSTATLTAVSRVTRSTKATRGRSASTWATWLHDSVGPPSTRIR